MSPATIWTELTVTDGGWQGGFTVPGGNPDDYYIDVLFEDTPFWNPAAAVYTEMSVAATAGTEMSVASTVWTELT